MLGVIAHQCAAELQRVGARRASGLVDEAFHVHRVLIGVDATPWPHRHVGIAHRVFHKQVRERVSELRVARLFVIPLELTFVLALRNR